MGGFSAKVGPGTVTNGPGLKNAPQIDQNYAGRSIIRVFRGDFVFDPQSRNLKPPISLTQEIKTAGPHKFIGLVTIDVAKPYRFIEFGDIDAPSPCEFIFC